MTDEATSVGCAAILRQAPPRVSDRTPAWELLLEELPRALARDLEVAPAEVLDGPTRRELEHRLRVDMVARDDMGRAKYGVPLTSGDGRDHLVDAYQEALDLLAYARQELDEAERAAVGKSSWGKHRDAVEEAVSLVLWAWSGVIALRRMLTRRGIT